MTGFREFFTVVVAATACVELFLEVDALWEWMEGDKEVRNAAQRVEGWRRARGVERRWMGESYARMVTERKSEAAAKEA